MNSESCQIADKLEIKYTVYICLISLKSFCCPELFLIYIIAFIVKELWWICVHHFLGLLFLLNQLIHPTCEVQMQLSLVRLKCGGPIPKRNAL